MPFSPEEIHRKILQSRFVEDSHLYRPSRQYLDLYDRFVVLSHDFISVLVMDAYVYPCFDTSCQHSIRVAR
jgi:hypothetical protein